MGLGTFAGQTQPKPVNPYAGLGAAAMGPQQPRPPATALGGLGATAMQAPRPVTTPGQPAPAAVAPQPQRVPMAAAPQAQPAPQAAPQPRAPMAAPGQVSTADYWQGPGYNGVPYPPSAPAPPPNTPNQGILGPTGLNGGGYDAGGTYHPFKNGLNSYGGVQGGAASQAGYYQGLAQNAAGTWDKGATVDMGGANGVGSAMTDAEQAARGGGQLQSAISGQFARDTANTINAGSALAASAQGGGPAAAAARAAASQQATTLNQQTQAEDQIRANAAAAAQGRFAGLSSGVAGANAQGALAQESLAAQTALGYNQLSAGVNQAQLQADESAFANSIGMQGAASAIQAGQQNAAIGGTVGAITGLGAAAGNYTPSQAPTETPPASATPAATTPPAVVSTDMRRGNFGSLLSGAPPSHMDSLQDPGNNGVGRGGATIAGPQGGEGGVVLPGGGGDFGPGNRVQPGAGLPGGPGAWPQYGGTGQGANKQAAYYQGLGNQAASSTTAPTVATADTDRALGLLQQTSRGGGPAQTSADAQFGEALGSSVAQQMGAAANTRGGAGLGAAAAAGQAGLMNQGGEAMTRAAQTQANMGGAAAAQYGSTALGLGTAQQTAQEQQNQLAAQMGLSYNQLANQQIESQLAADTASLGTSTGLQTQQMQQQAAQSNAIVGGLVGAGTGISSMGMKYGG